MKERSNMRNSLKRSGIILLMTDSTITKVLDWQERKEEKLVSLLLIM